MGEGEEEKEALLFPMTWLLGTYNAQMRMRRKTVPGVLQVGM
jgi:hypothetical protein